MHIADAIAMCQNIHTEEKLAALLFSYEINLVKYNKNLPIKKLIRVLHMLMTHDAFRFGTTYYRQKIVHRSELQ